MPRDTINPFCAHLPWILCALGFFASNDQHLWLPSNGCPGLLEPLYLLRQLKVPGSPLSHARAGAASANDWMESMKAQLLWEERLMKPNLHIRAPLGIRLELRFLPKLGLCLSSPPTPPPSRFCFLHSLIVFSHEHLIHYLLTNPCFRVYEATWPKATINEFIYSFFMILHAKKSSLSDLSFKSEHLQTPKDSSLGLRQKQDFE